MAEYLITENNESLPWTFIPLHEYKAPVAPVSHAARSHFLNLQRLFQRHSEDEPVDVLCKTDNDLQPLPLWQLQQILPEPDWQSAAAALYQQLKDWLIEPNPKAAIVVLVAPPCSGISKILPVWATQYAWTEISPPTTEQVLANDNAWFSELVLHSNGWVLSHLEKLYLRQAGGLNFIRQFFEQAFSGQFGRGIVCCDSWAWSFLQSVWHGRLPVVLTLQACDPVLLGKALLPVADKSSDHLVYFRQADNGHYLIPPPNVDETSPGMNKYFQLLAAHSRGIAGIAREIWRVGLRTEPDVLIRETTAALDKPSTQTLWVTPWNESKFPELPSGSGRNEAFVCHALLLHNGLTATRLRQLLPLSPNETSETVFRLQAVGVIAGLDGVLRVTALGYLAVRQFLLANGYLADHF